MSPSRRELLAFRIVGSDPPGLVPSGADRFLAQDPNALLDEPACSAELAFDEAPPPWACADGVGRGGGTR